MIDHILTGIVIAAAVVAIQWAISLLRRCWRQRHPRNWEHVVQAHHLLDTTPKQRGKKWP